MISPTRILLTAETRTQHESRTSNQVTNIKVFPTPAKWMRDSEQPKYWVAHVCVGEN